VCFNPLPPAPAGAVAELVSRYVFTRMKRFLIILGSIFLIIIVLAAIGIGVVAVRGGALDKESKAYADAAIPRIIAT
jgi:hypothetical protein